MTELDDLVKTIWENLDIFRVGRGIKSRDIIEDFFKETYGVENMPSSVVDFYTNFDGIAFSTVGDVFSIIPNDNVDDYEEMLDETIMNEILASIGLDNNDYHFFFIGSDGMGGYYAIRTDTGDDRVYWLDHEFPEKFKEALDSGTYDNALVFESFNAFLDSMLEDTITIEREDEQDF